MTRAARFSQADVVRFAKGVKAAGFDISGIEMTPDGTMRALTGAAPKVERALSPLEAWEREHGVGAA